MASPLRPRTISAPGALPAMPRTRSPTSSPRPAPSSRCTPSGVAWSAPGCGPHRSPSPRSTSAPGSSACTQAGSFPAWHKRPSTRLPYCARSNAIVSPSMTSRRPWRRDWSVNACCSPAASGSGCWSRNTFSTPPCAVARPCRLSSAIWSPPPPPRRIMGGAGESERRHRARLPGRPARLWSELEAAASTWLSNGRPGLERYGLTVTPETNTVWLDDPGNTVGTLGE